MNMFEAKDYQEKLLKSLEDKKIDRISWNIYNGKTNHIYVSFLILMWSSFVIFVSLILANTFLGIMLSPILISVFIFSYMVNFKWLTFKNMNNYMRENESYKIDGKYYSLWYIKTNEDKFNYIKNVVNNYNSMEIKVNNPNDNSEIKEELIKNINKRFRRDELDKFVSIKKIQIRRVKGNLVSVNFDYYERSYNDIEKALNYNSREHNVSIFHRDRRDSWKNNIETNRVIPFIKYIKMSKKLKRVDDLFKLDDDIIEFQEYYGLRAKINDEKSEK
ncbi:hypothetical protein [Staphylococcus phage vB_StaM_SA1]|nr:hypothetical protein [Staphylococcus phage vB_StaM_SA1]